MDKFPNKKFIGKIVEKENKNPAPGKPPTYYKILIDNPRKTKKDGSEDTFHKGKLFYVDDKTGKTYQIFQASLFEASELQKEKIGAVFSVMIDLDNSFDAKEVDENGNIIE